jgi:hypothetical protein
VILKYTDKPTLLGHTSHKLGRTFITPVYLLEDEEVEHTVAAIFFEGFIFQKIAEHLLYADQNDEGMTVTQLRDALGEKDTSIIQNALVANRELFWRDEQPIFVTVKNKLGRMQKTPQYRWHLRPDQKAALFKR